MPAVPVITNVSSYSAYSSVIMRPATLSALALAASCVAQDMSINMMGTLMSLKTAHHDVKKSAGVFREGAYESMGATKCQNGKAGEYSCKNIDLLGSLTHEAMGSTTREGNDVWGAAHSTPLLDKLD